MILVYYKVISGCRESILNYLTEGESPDKVEALKAFNAEAKKPIDYGFKIR